MIRPNRKYLAFFVAAVLFAMVTAGGCGGSSSNNFFNGNSDITGVNAVLSGVWRLDTSATDNFVSMDVNGTQASLAVVDFALHFRSLDVEESSGTVCYDAIVIFSSDRVIIPGNLEGVQADTQILTPGTWSVTGKNITNNNLTGNSITYTMTLGGTEANPSLHLRTNTRLANADNVTYVMISLNFKKYTTHSDMTSEEMNTLINGTWQTPLSRPTISGGFIFTSGDSPAAPEGDASQERSDAPRVNGMREIDNIFANHIFEETDIAARTTRLTSQVSLATMNASGDYVGMVQPVILHDYDGAKITPLFNGAYRIDITSLDRALLLVDENHTNARMITTSVQLDDNGGFAQVSTIQTLEKKPSKDESTFNITEQVGTIWTSKGFAVGEIRDPSASGLGQSVEFDFLGLIFPENAVDLVNRTFTVKVTAQYHDTKPENAASGSGNISRDIAFTYIERIGYNTWYVDDGDDETEGDNRVIITALEQYVLVTAWLDLNGKEISIVAFLSKEGDADDMFFSGVWQCFSKDATVHLTVANQFDGDVTLLNFGAKFSSVDIDAGTAKLSAVVVLSADLMLIPMVFDNENVSVEPGTNAGEYVVTTQHGAFTVTGSPDDGLDHIRLQGNITYAEMGFTVNIDATLSRVLLGVPGQETIESRQLDFTQIMNGSTWQTIPFASQSGGFAMGYNSSGATMYPGIGSKTFANMIFNGNSTGGTINGYGAMALQTFDAATRSFVDNGTVFPVTMLNQSVNISNIFANYYRFELAGGDTNLKGVFIIESETDARMILFTTVALPTVEMRLHTLFTLKKVTESQAIDLTAFNNTSWDVAQVGGYLLLPSEYGSQSNTSTPISITENPTDIYSLSVKSADVKFTEANLAARTARFTLSVYITLPILGVTNRYFEVSRVVEVEHVGAYTWRAKTTGADSDGSDFLVTLSAAYPDRAAIAGNVTLKSPMNPDTYLRCSLLMDLVMK